MLAENQSTASQLPATAPLLTEAELVRPVSPSSAHTVAEETATKVVVAIKSTSRLVQVQVPVSWYTSSCKRLLDILLSLSLLVLALPVILLAALLVRLTSRGPAFYSQTRVGRGGKPFTIYKLRSMYYNCEAKSGAAWSKKGDPRVTPVGKFLRRSHIDELPQLWNILKGDMSLVGPRPERPEFVPQLEAAIPRYRERLLVLPGVTGLAQVHLGPDTDLASVERKLAFDLYYVQHLGLWNDLKIIVATAIHVFWPLRGGRVFFRLDARTCADAVGMVTPREE